MTFNDWTPSRMAFFVAPILMGVSTFYWEEGAYGITGGTLLIGSLLFYILALQSLFQRLHSAWPRYANWGYLIALAGCISGINFGFTDVMREAFDISHQTFLDRSSGHATAFNLLLFWTGPLFPLSLLILGIQMIRSRDGHPVMAALLSISGIAFPLSRILRIEWIGHLADAILLIPFFYYGWQYVKSVSE